MSPRRALIFLGISVSVVIAGGIGLLALSPSTDVQAVAVAPSPTEPTSIEALLSSLEAPRDPQIQDDSPQPPALRTDVFGALPSASNFSSPFSPYLPLRSSRDFAPPPPSLTSSAATQETAPALSQAPLPPSRPAELSVAAEVPLPPARPADLEAPVVVASLAPQQTPESKPQLVEPKPPAVEPKPVVAPPAAESAPDVPFKMGQSVFVRIFKQEGQLELWLKRGPKLALYKTYSICKWSGHIGPKLREADYQSPEGFYSVSAKQLRPNSNYFRAFDVGFPNALDKQMGYTGGLIMVHGDCKSVGCFAMTNAGIDEIYNFVSAALGNGQREVPVHIFPFRMTDTAMARETGGGWLSFAAAAHSQYAPFWRNLKEGYDLFEQTGEPPVAYACGGKYAFNNGASCKRIAGW